MIRHRVTAERIASGKGVVCIRQFDASGNVWATVARAGDAKDLVKWAMMMETAGSLGLHADAESTFIRFDDRHGIAVVRDAQAGVVSVAVYTPSCPAIKSLRRRLRALNAAYVVSQATAKEAA